MNDDLIRRLNSVLCNQIAKSKSPFMFKFLHKSLNLGIPASRSCRCRRKHPPLKSRSEDLLLKEILIDMHLSLASLRYLVNLPLSGVELFLAAVENR